MKHGRADSKPAIQILFADNDQNFIHAPARTLRQQGWQVITAATLDEARAELEGGWFHVAILDLRLTEDEDDHDISGLALAHEPQFASIPKIIYTTYVNGAQREAQALAHPLLLVSKQDDRSKLVEAVQTALNQTPTNWNVQIVFPGSATLSFEYLADAIGRTKTKNAELEVSDLLRRLFYNERRVSIGRVLWEQGERIAIEVSTQAPVAGKEYFVVVFGPRKLIEEEVRLFRKAVPRAQGANSTHLSYSAVTVHFGAIAYAIYTREADRITHLGAAYSSSNGFHGTLKGLFEVTLPPWHRDDSRQGGETPGEFYRRALLGDAKISTLATAIKDLVRQSGRAKFELRLEKGRLRLPGDKTKGHLDPLTRVSEWNANAESAWVSNAPGRLSAENVLVDHEGRAWCTDFSGAGAAPVLVNHVTLEAMIRFDWVECATLKDLYEMERRLNGAEDFEQVDAASIDKGCKAAILAIREVRSLASRTHNFDKDSYDAGIYYEAIRRIEKHDPSETPAVNKLVRLLHAVIAAAMIASPIAGASPSMGIEIDMAKHQVTVNGHSVKISNLEFAILCCLKARNGAVCIFSDIFTEAFREQYAGRDSQKNKLHRAMWGLREALGDENCIDTVRGIGFRLTK